MDRSVRPGRIERGQLALAAEEPVGGVAEAGGGDALVLFERERLGGPARDRPQVPEVARLDAGLAEQELVEIPVALSDVTS